MNEHRAELATLHRDIDRIERELRFLRLRADNLESRIGADEVREAAPEPVVHKVAAVPPPLPPYIQPAPIAQSLPPVIEEPVLAAAPVAEMAQPEPEFSPAPEPVMAQTVEPKPSFELRLGTFWFVRIGIVMLLTTMVFLGNYAYQHYVPLLSPFGKVILLYAASFGLLAAGAILPRKQERLKNYGQVLFGGGLAAVYFTTYAAHHFPNLRVIESAVLDGGLLLAWTAFIVWRADRKKSEVLAVFGIGLAYYSALITNVGNFTLISNLILAVAAVFLLVRNLWVGLTFLSLAASYGSYFYWRYYVGTPGLENDPSRLSLAGYWVIFTAAVFLARHEGFAGRARASFLSFNNGAAFALLTFSLLRMQSGNFWKLSLGSGVLLLAMSGLARLFIKEDELPRRAYLAQGLLLTTLGFMTKFSGPTLGLVLAVESALLLVFSTQWKSRLLRNASIIVAILGAGWLVFTLKTDDPRAWLKAASLGLLLLFQATWAAKTSEAPAEADPVQTLPAFFTGLAICSWLAMVFTLGTAAQIGPILAGTGLALTLSFYLLRVREIVVLSQGLVLIGQAHALIHSVHAHPPMWSPLTVIAISIVLSIWWKRQTVFESAEQTRVPLEVLSAFAGAAILYAWLPREIAGDKWIAIAAALTIGWTAFGGAIRSWAHVAAAQIFLLGTAGLTLLRLVDGQEPAWFFPMALIGAFVLLAAAAHFLKVRDEVQRPLRILGTIYQWLGAFLTLACVMNYVVPENRFIVLVGLFITSLVPAMFGAKYTFGPGAFLAAAGVGYWLVTWRSSGAEVQNLCAILMLATAQWTLRKKSEPMGLPVAAHSLWICVVAGALWLFVSRWVIDHSQGAHFYLSASWAGLAFLFFIVGLVLRERAYRWAALVVLASTLGRVVILDVWKLETIYRIVSFLALSVVLLALGYIYSRFQDKFAKWL